MFKFLKSLFGKKEEVSSSNSSYLVGEVKTDNKPNVVSTGFSNVSRYDEIDTYNECKLCEEAYTQATKPNKKKSKKKSSKEITEKNYEEVKNLLSKLSTDKINISKKDFLKKPKKKSKKK